MIHGALLSQNRLVFVTLRLNIRGERSLFFTWDFLMSMDVSMDVPIGCWRMTCQKHPTTVWLKSSPFSCDTWLGILSEWALFYVVCWTSWQFRDRKKTPYSYRITEGFFTVHNIIDITAHSIHLSSLGNCIYTTRRQKLTRPGSNLVTQRSEPRRTGLAIDVILTL